jgi:cold shock CspA family protein
MVRAEVDWFSENRCYGFARLAGGVRVFIHKSAIRMEEPRKLQEGQIVYLQFTDYCMGIKATIVYPGDIYKARMAALCRGKRLSAEELIRDEHFLEEVRFLFDQLPARVSPDRQWVIDRMTRWEPTALTDGDLKEQTIRELWMEVLGLESEFQRELVAVGKRIDDLEKKCELGKGPIRKLVSISRDRVRSIRMGESKMRVRWFLNYIHRCLDEGEKVKLTQT